VSGRVYQVELILSAIFRFIQHAHGVQLDGDAALPLEVHGVQHLRFHLAFGQRAGHLQQAIRQRGLAVVDMSDNAEISDVVDAHSL
jgi:hypothetical protein